MDLFVTLIILMINVAAVCDVLLILKVFFGADIRLSGRMLFVVGSIFFVLNLVLSCIPGGDAYTGIVVLGYMMTIIMLFSNSKRIRNTFLAIPAALMYVQWGTMFSLFEQLTGLEKFGYNYKNSELVTPLYFVSDILLFVLLWWVYKKVNRAAVSVQFSKLEGVLITIVCIVYPIVVAFFNYLQGSIDHVLYQPFWLVIMILINVAVIYAVVHRKKATYYKLVANQYKDQFQAEYDSFQDYKASNSELIKFRHDWNNHMLVLQELFHQGEYEKANSYFSELTAMTKSMQKTYVTGNEIVDMLLKSKYHLLESNGITFQMTGNLTEFSFMEDVDCCILFANLLDNAIEANMGYEGERFIHLDMNKTKGLLYFQMTNPYAEITKDTIAEKSNGDVHGIGLSNVAEIVQKYDGEHSTEKRDDTFIVKCCFPIA